MPPKNDSRLGVEIRYPGALQLGDHVLEHELPLLQAAEHDLIHMRIVCKPRDYLVQILVLYTQLLESLNVFKHFSFDLLIHYSLWIAASQSRVRSPKAKKWGLIRSSFVLYLNACPA